MTPDERTVVLAAMLNYRRESRGSHPHIEGKIAFCPSSWFHSREQLGANVWNDWDSLTLEHQLGIWLTAPDSDYTYVIHNTQVMKGQTQ